MYLLMELWRLVTQVQSFPCFVLEVHVTLDMTSPSLLRRQKTHLVVLLRLPMIVTQLLL